MSKLMGSMGRFMPKRLDACSSSLPPTRATSGQRGTGTKGADTPDTRDSRAKNSRSVTLHAPTKYLRPGVPFSKARRMASAASRASTYDRPPGGTAGMRRSRNSRTSSDDEPLMSPGPSSSVGFTLTTWNSGEFCSRAHCSANSLER
jgi:hypothetical protein